MKRSLYDVLGVEGASGTSEIESAYQAKMAKLKGAFDDESQNDLKLLQQAHTILIDPEQRAKYDKQMKLEKLMHTSAIQQQEAKKEGSLLPLLLIITVIGAVIYFGYRHYEREHAATSVQQHATPAATGN